MKLKYYDKQYILQDFPQIELSYEKNIHKKVHNTNLCLIIPKGQKYFAWFRYYKKYIVCCFLQLEGKHKINDIMIYNCCFHNELCNGKGTILYGTIFVKNNRKFFTIENIFYFKNKNISNYNQFEKFNIIKELFNNYIKQTAFIESDIIIGLPIFSSNYKSLLEKKNTIAYEPYCIQYRSLDKNMPFLNKKIYEKQYAIFHIKPTIQTDIYELYSRNYNKLVVYNIAHIPDYKTSVLMNDLFRNIKENGNLDLLEESDDEEEFQNICLDKYVYLDKTYNMRCVWNRKFCKWQPIEIDTNEKVSLQSDIINMEK